MDQNLRDLAERHLKDLLQSDAFIRAPLQARVLELLVQAALDGRRVTGRELSRELYGKTDENYQRAMRQVVRELRLKLPRIYERRPPDALVFGIAPDEYRVHIQRRPVVREEPRGASSGARRRFAMGAGLLLVAVAVLGSILAGRSLTGRPGPQALPAAVEKADDDVVVRDGEGNPLPAWTGRLEAALGYPLSTIPWGGIPSILVTSFGQAGSPRIAFLAAPPEPSPFCDLVVFDASSGSLVGKHKASILPDGVPPEASLHEVAGETFRPRCFPHSISAADLDGDGEANDVLVSIADDRLFPCRVLALNPDRDWAPILDYWSMGWVTAHTMNDVDGDGIDEVVLHGTNNGERAAIVILLHSGDGWPRPGRSTEGHRRILLEEVEDYPVRGLHLRFPRSHLGSPAAAETWVPNPEATEVSWDPREGVVRVMAMDGTTLPYSRDPVYFRFVLGVGSDEWTVSFINYDAFYHSFRLAIARGAVEDQWGILETQRLDGYAPYLLSQLAYLDPDGPEPAGWRPLTRDQFPSLWKGSAR